MLNQTLTNSDLVVANNLPCHISCDEGRLTLGGELEGFGGPGRESP